MGNSCMLASGHLTGAGMDLIFVANVCVTVHTFSWLVHSLIRRFGDSLEESMHTNMVCFCCSVQTATS
jgi:hypothetical protein